MKSRAGLTFLLINVVLSSWVLRTPPALAQKEVCRDVGEVAPTKTLRTVELPKFGINIDIPKNYRSMSRSDGSIEILDPNQFAMVSCIARGGKVLNPHGWLSFKIRQINHPKNVDLITLVNQLAPHQNTERSVYDLDGTGVIINQDNGRGGFAEAWFIPPSTAKAVVMTISCDCRIKTEDIVRELNRTKLR